MSIHDLPALARDLWWTTDPDAHLLWSDLAGLNWNVHGQNPVALLKHIDLEQVQPDLSDRADRLMERWPRGTRTTAPPTQRKVAYFCMEFGLHEGLPIYSGGLGMLAGDHLRSACDMGLDLVAVGLFYRQGYFTQQVAGSVQVATYPQLDPKSLPLTRVRGADGQPLRVSIPDGSGSFLAEAWEVRIGSIRLFLLDTDLPENPEPCRELTQRLYGGNNQLRLMQEVLLGFGGKALLDALSIRPDVFHMNEGHAAFLVLALAAEAQAHGTEAEKAWMDTRNRCVFTTHTPVPAGHDRFPLDNVAAVLGPTLESAGMTREQWSEHGKTSDKGMFCMSTLAIVGSRAVNGVSVLHASVSNRMFAHLEQEVTPITNGVHPTAWMAPETARLFDMHLPEWRQNISHSEFWEDTDQIPTQDWWALRCTLRQRLLQHVRTTVGRNVLNDDHLTICFARRFATYKRAGLIFSDPDRLAAILDRGVQLIFAGKAHPRDQQGQALLGEILNWTRDSRFAGRLVFVPGYDPGWGRLLTQGADVWLNTPRRPQEASGTSGQKAALNGNPNLSVLDGWWPEAYDGKNGWAIEGASDFEDAMHLYRLLEDEIIPSFEDRADWTQRMAHVAATCIPVFNTDRMLRDYCRLLYDPPTS